MPIYKLLAWPRPGRSRSEPRSRARAAARSSPARSGSWRSPSRSTSRSSSPRRRGATLTDVDGNTFIDFAGGVGCLNVGHSHPRVVEAIRDQAERFTHTDFTVVPYENYVHLAERLLELAPISGETRAAFFNSGAEAVENSVKFARAATGARR